MLDKLNTYLSCAIITKDVTLLNNLELLFDELIKSDDFMIENEVLVKWIVKNYRLSVIRRDYALDMSKDTLENELNYNLLTNIKKFNTNRKTMLNLATIYNLEIQSSKEEYCAIVANKVLELYDNIILQNEIDISKCSRLFEYICKDLKNERFRGILSSLSEDFNRDKDIDELISDASSDFTNLARIANEEEICRASEISEIRKRDLNKTSFRVMSGLGIKDYAVKIFNRDIVTIIGDEGVGKTNFVVNILVENLINGNNVLFYRGETEEQKLRYMMFANFIKRTFNMKFDWKELVSDDMGEDTRIIVESAKIKFSELPGKLFIKRFVNIDTFYEDCKKDIRKFNIKVVGLDHVGLLKTNTKKIIGERIDEFYKILIDLKEEDITSIVLSHTGSDASKGRDEGTRIGGLNSATTKDADVVIYLRTDKNLKLQGIINLIPKKLREWTSGVRDIMIKQDFGSTFDQVEGIKNSFEELF